jgi:hypothetical protein
MPKQEHCGNRSPHGPHIWYAPSSNPKETKQVAYHCPGTPRDEK